MKIEYIPQGVCASKIEIELDENDIIKDLKVTGGCPGNGLGIRSLCIGKTKTEIIEKLENIRCGYKQTSCPDQIAKALKNNIK